MKMVTEKRENNIPRTVFVISLLIMLILAIFSGFFHPGSSFVRWEAHAQGGIELLDAVVYIEVSLSNEFFTSTRGRVFVRFYQGKSYWTKSKGVYLFPLETQIITFKFTEPTIFGSTDFDLEVWYKPGG